MSGTSLKFGTSGLRGLADELNGLPAYAYSLAFVGMLSEAGKLRKGDKVFVGRDLRPSSPAIAALCMAAIEDAKPVFVTPPEMRAWLESDEITAYTDAGDWPTPDTAALWARFRTEALSGGIQKWSVEHYKRLLDTAAAPPAGLYRIVTDEGDGRTWLATPDYQRVAAFKKPAVDPKPSLFSGRLPGNTRLVEALRVGRGKLRWPTADQ